MGASAQLESGVLVDQYQEWCRAQYQMAHHDIWWPKGQQMKAANSTLLLLGAIVGASNLLWLHHDDLPVIGRIMLSALSAVTVALGIAYAWNLHWTMVRARVRAKKIAGLVADKYDVLKGALDDPKRDFEFPLIISGIHVVALAVVLSYYWT